MSTQTLADINAKIAELQKQADEIVKTQRSAHIADMRVLIADFGITASELGFTGVAKSSKAATSSTKAPAVMKYKDDAGNTWSGGRGPRPKWVKEIEAAGKNIEDYRI